MPAWHVRRTEPVIGVMLHYDASASDKGAVAWLTKDPRCKVSYHWLVLDSGEVVPIAPPTARAWHAGVCRSSDPRLPYRDANSAFYGIALAAKAGDPVSDAQKGSVLRLIVERFQAHGWSLLDNWRLVSHHTEAWPRGRKVDVVGPDPSNPVMDLEEMRRWLSTAQ